MWKWLSCRTWLSKKMERSWNCECVRCMCVGCGNKHVHEIVKCIRDSVSASTSLQVWHVNEWNKVYKEGKIDYLQCFWSFTWICNHAMWECKSIVSCCLSTSPCDTSDRYLCIFFENPSSFSLSTSNISPYVIPCDKVALGECDLSCINLC